MTPELDLVLGVVTGVLIAIAYNLGKYRGRRGA